MQYNIAPDMTGVARRVPGVVYMYVAFTMSEIILNPVRVEIKRLTGKVTCTEN